MRPTVQNVGYIGLGIMGSAMAANLLKAGYKLSIWNRAASKCKTLAAQGATVARSPAALAAAGPQVICINVTDTKDVEQVIFGENGIIHGAKPGLVVIDHSTISPVETQRFAAELAKKDIFFLDAPVSGGDVGATNGTLSIMVGGDEEIFDHCLPVFQSVGRSITHLGASGMGQVCKACNQIAVVCNLIGACEAMALAKKSGLKLESMIEVVSAGAGASWQLKNLGPKIIHDDTAPGFTIDLLLKDLAIIDSVAQTHGLPLNATALARDYFQAVAAAGEGDRGTQAVAHHVEKLGGFVYGED